jgi:hypothetical protein
MKTNSLDYEGILNSEIRVQLLDFLSAIAIAHLGKRKDLRKLCSIAIELLDNAQRHCTDSDISFKWHIEGDSLIVKVENHASEEDANRLKSQVEALRQMTSQQITDEFRKQMLNPEFNAKGGAGLGILQIAKKGATSFEVDVHQLLNGAFVCTSTVETPLTQARA